MLLHVTALSATYLVVLGAAQFFFKVQINAGVNT